MLLVVCQYAVMLLAVKTVKSDWCVSIRLLLVKKSVGLLLVKCLLFVCFVVVVNKSCVWCR